MLYVGGEMGFSRLLIFSITIIGAIIQNPNSIFAQITPDYTLPSNSRVTEQDNIRVISGGTQVGSNLFHSFSEFSVPTGTNTT